MERKRDAATQGVVRNGIVRRVLQPRERRDPLLQGLGFRVGGVGFKV